MGCCLSTTSMPSSRRRRKDRSTAPWRPAGEDLTGGTAAGASPGRAPPRAPFFRRAHGGHGARAGPRRPEFRIYIAGAIPGLAGGGAGRGSRAPAAGGPTDDRRDPLLPGRRRLRGARAPCPRLPDRDEKSGGRPAAPALERRLRYGRGAVLARDPAGSPPRRPCRLVGDDPGHRHQHRSPRGGEAGALSALVLPRDTGVGAGAVLPPTAGSDVR